LIKLVAYVLNKIEQNLIFGTQEGAGIKFYVAENPGWVKVKASVKRFISSIKNFNNSWRVSRWSKI